MLLALSARAATGMGLVDGPWWRAGIAFAACAAAAWAAGVPVDNDIGLFFRSLALDSWDRFDSPPRVVAVTGDPDCGVNKGILCVKGYHLPAVLTGEDRLRHPMVRRGDRYEQLDLGAVSFVPLVHGS